MVPTLLESICAGRYRGNKACHWYSGWMEQQHSAQRLQELASVLARARKLEGVEKNELYKAFRLPQLAEQIAAAMQ